MRLVVQKYEIPQLNYVAGILERIHADFNSICSQYDDATHRNILPKSRGCPGSHPTYNFLVQCLAVIKCIGSTTPNTILYKILLHYCFFVTL